MNFLKKHYKTIILYFVAIILFNFLYAKYFNEPFNLLSSVALATVCFLVSLTNSKK
ncbi:MAG: hypothetical protein ACRCSK_02440 [Fusobacteriaceae bacterium]